MADVVEEGMQRQKDDEEGGEIRKGGSEIIFGGRLGDLAPAEDEEDSGADEEYAAKQVFNVDEDGENDPLLQAAIREHCKVLGIDSDKYPEFTYVAKESLLAPVPDGWKEHRHEDGNPFYVNLETGVSQWEHPLDEFYSEKFKKLLKEKKNQEKKKRKDNVNSKSNKTSGNGNSKIQRGSGSKKNSLNMNQKDDDGQNNNTKGTAKKLPTKKEETEDTFLKQAILEQCKILGIDPIKYPEYVYIAKESLLAPVPDGWEERDEGGDPFYLHIESGKTQWEHPEDDAYRMRFKKAIESAKVKSKNTPNDGVKKPAASANEDWDDWDDIDDQDSTTPNAAKQNYAKAIINISSSTSTHTKAMSGNNNDTNDEIMEDWDDESEDEEAEKVSKTKQYQHPKASTKDKIISPTNIATDSRKLQPSIVESSTFPLESSEITAAKSSGSTSSGNNIGSAPESPLDEQDAKQIFQMESSMRLMKSENDDLRKRIVNLDVERLSMSNTHKKVTEEMQEKIDLIREASDKLKIEQEETEQKLRIREDRLTTMKAENQILKQSVEELEKSKAGLELSLTRSNKDQDEELGMVKNRIEILTKEKQDLKLELHETKVSYEKLSSTTTRRVQSSMQTARNAQTARKQAEDRVKELEKELKQIQTDKASITRALEIEVKNAKKRARDAENAKSTAISGAKKKYEFDNSKFDGLNKQLEEASNNLITKANRIKELQVRVKELETENDELKGEISTLKISTKAEEIKTSTEPHGTKSDNKTPETTTVAQISAPPTQQQQQQHTVNVELYTSEIIRLKTELAASERRLRDAERLASKAEERADRAESSYTESAVENELATSLGIKVYELEREKEKLESLIRDAGVDKDLYKAQTEAALRERGQVLERIKVEQERNDALVSDRQRQSEEKIRLIAQVEQLKSSEKRLNDMIKTMRKEHEENRKILSSQTESVNGSKVNILNAVREERERLKVEHDKTISTLRKELLNSKQQNANANIGTEYEGKFVALREEIRLLKVENNALKSLHTNNSTLQTSSTDGSNDSSNNATSTVIDKTTGIKTTEREAALASQLQDVFRQSAATISTHIQEISALRSRISTLQEENSLLKIGANENLETWKRRAAEAMAESEALRIERNERRVDMKELREEWKLLHKELRDVKVQEMVARESAIRAETKLEKLMGDTDTHAASRMSSFLEDMRGLVEQVASFQASPHEALMDGSTSFVLGDQSSNIMSPQQKNRGYVGKTSSPNQYITSSAHNHHSSNNNYNSLNYPRAPESSHHAGNNNMPPPPPRTLSNPLHRQPFQFERNKYDSARREIETLREQLAEQQKQHSKSNNKHQFGGGI